MDRRELIAAIGSLPVWSMAAIAQQNPLKLGILLGNSPDPRPIVTALQQQLRDLGYVEGRNIAFETRSGEANLEQMTVMARQLAALKPDVVFAYPTPAATAAKSIFTGIPVVIISADPVGTGLVASLARPGGNITGVSTAVSELGAKNLELMREVLPSALRVGVLVNPNDPFNKTFLEHIRHAAGVLGVAISVFTPRNAGEVDQAFAEIDKVQVQAVIIQPTLPLDLVARLSLARRLPSFSPNPGFTAAGGMISYSSDLSAVGRDCAAIVDKVLKGRRPADLPVELPSKFWLVVNLKTAKALGVDVPGTMLTRADEVIE
jgi:putative ABC transport system substrate-binding protein